MKAIVCTEYGTTEVLKLKEIKKPHPGDNEVLIKIYAAAINSTDPTFRKGSPLISRIFTGLFKPKNSIPGDVLAGEIESVGKDVDLFKPGDQVYGATGMNLGAHAEYICLPENSALAIKAGTMTYQEAAAIVDGALTALPFLRDKGRIKKNQKVLIYGASGSVGTAAVQLARYFGADVTGVCSTANLQLVSSIGANTVIDYTKEDFTKNGMTYDIIFDAVGKSSFSRCKNSLNPRGIYLTTVPTITCLFQKLVTSIGNNKKADFAATGLRKPHEKAKDLIFLKKLIEKGALKSIIDRQYPLDQIADAHQYVESGHKKGNVVLKIN